MSKPSHIGFFSIASAFVGTLIGAGFASGQEMLQFFAVFGPKGLLGAGLSSLLFIILAFVAMSMAKSHGTARYDELVVPGGNRFLRTLLNIAMVLFLFGIITVMVAGSGALFRQQFGLSSLLGSVFMAVICAVTVIMGLQSLVKSFNVVVPFMVIIALVVGMLAVNHAPIQAVRPLQYSTNDLIGNWFTSALIFVSYNTFGAIAVLTPLGHKAKDRWNILLGATLGGAALGVLAMVLCRAIIAQFFMIYDAEMPLMALASSLGPIWGTIYSMVLLAGIYTTAVGCLFAIVARFAVKTKRHWLVIIIVIMALLGSQVGFVQLIAVIYPLSGYLGALVCLGLLYNAITKRSSRG